MTRVIIIRHGETEWNASVKYQGHTDVELSEVGKAQAVKVGERLKKEKINAIYSSDLKRAYDTGLQIAKRCRLSCITQEDLRETSFGEWEGLTYKEISSKYPKLVKKWRSDPETIKPPGGESFRQMQERVINIFNKIISKHPGETVALISHGGTIRVLLCYILGVKLKYYWKFKVDNCSITRIEIHEEKSGILCSLNDTCHIN